MKRRKSWTHFTTRHSSLTHWLLTAYRRLLCLYPALYRARFAEEMTAVFAEAVEEAAANGWLAIGQFILRELRDLPGVLWHEYRQVAQLWVAQRLQEEARTHTDLPGVVPVGYGSWPHLFFVLTGRHPRLRRAFDITLALIGLMLVSPLLLLLPILIKLDTDGPVFYRQKRLGRDGQPYVMYKFRSMVPSSVYRSEAATSPQITTAPRITRMGNLTRRWHLDEIPQVFNVLKGDMSIFGPRPPMTD